MRRLHGLLAVVAMTAACIEPTNSGGGGPYDAEVDAAPDVAVDVTSDTTPADAAPDTAPADVTPADVTPADVTPADATADAEPADVTPVDVATDTAPADVTVDAARADVTVDVAPADVATDAARVDATTDAATADVVTADVATDAARLDAAVDASPVDAAVDAPPADVPTGPSVELWLLRVGDGTAALTNSATPLLIERRASNGGAMLGASINLPIAASGANRPIALSGTATSEGSLTRSANGRFVTLAGYAAVPGTATVATSAADVVPRVVARVGADGSIDTSTTLGGTFSANNVRGAVTVDGESFWVAGTAASGALGGVQYALRGGASAPVSIIATPSNVRSVNIFGGQLYGASSTTNFYGLFVAGTGTPTATATGTLLPGFSSASGPSPYGFTLLDRDPAVAGVDTAYVADDRAVASGGGVQRWTLVAGTWTLGATFNTGITSGVRGLTAWAEGANVAVAAVTAETPSRVVIYRDVPGATPGAATVVSTAPTNTHYRGVALAPTL